MSAINRSKLQQPGGSAARYTRTAIILHWSIAVTMIGTIPLGIYGADNEGTLSDKVINIHKCVGILILCLTVLRILWRIGHRPPALPSSMHRLFKVIARLVHVVFYAVLLAMPLSGWWMTSAFPGRHAFGIGPIELPFLPVSRNLPAAQVAHAVHQTLGWMTIGLILLHVLAALKHHFIDRDNVLQGMAWR